MIVKKNEKLPRRHFINLFWVKLYEACSFLNISNITISTNIYKVLQLSSKKIYICLYFIFIFHTIDNHQDIEIVGYCSHAKIQFCKESYVIPQKCQKYCFRIFFEILKIFAKIAWSISKINFWHMETAQTFILKVKKAKD